MKRRAQLIGMRRNTLLRYRLVMEEFEKHNHRDIPITKIHKKHIYPKFAISRDTLYTIFSTDIEGELAELEKVEKVETTQLSMF